MARLTDGRTGPKGRRKSTSVILCAGKASRFDGVPKQILPAGNGETFISRIVRQVRQRNGRPIVVTDREVIRKSGGAPSYDPGPTDYVVETLAGTVHLWGKRTHVLLGDVCYSRDCMDRIFRFDGEIAVWGNLWEIYALSFWIDYRNPILEAVDLVLSEQVAPTISEILYTTTGETFTPYIPSADPGRGKLRRLYQALAGIPFGSAIEHKNSREVLHYVGSGDYTRDVDTLEDYANFRSEVLWGGRLDDD
jgi:hypothetical protein